MSEPEEPAGTEPSPASAPGPGEPSEPSEDKTSARRRGRLRRLGILVGLLLVGGLALARRAAIREPEARPDPAGVLRSALELELPIEATLGRFRVALTEAEGGLQLIVRDHGDGDRVLLETPPGEAFLRLGTGHLEIADSRGSFELTDTVRTLSAHQVVTGREFEPGRLTLRGRWGDAGPAWKARLAADGGRLAIGFELPEPPQDAKADHARLTLRLARDDATPLYGFGTQCTELDLRGRRFHVLSQEQGIGRGSQPATALLNIAARSGGSWSSSYAPMPWLFGADLRTLLVDDTEPVFFDLTRRGRTLITIPSERLNVSVFAGATPAEILRSLTAHTGRMKPLPEWTQAGAIIGMQGGTARVRETLARCDAAEVPLAGFWLQDWVGQRKTNIGWQLWWNWELDRDHYPGWSELVAELEARDIGVLAYINPFLVDTAEKPNARSNAYAEARERGFLVKDSHGEVCSIPITSYDAGLVDLSNPEARAWLAALLKRELLPLGVKGWMADFGEALPFESRLADGRPALGWHNRYPVEWARFNRELQRESGLGDSGFFFTRAGYTQSPGASRCFWLGDQLVTWDAHDGLASALRGLLSSGLSGISLNHSDIGGYTSIAVPGLRIVRSRELLMRWMEFAAFTTLFRTHEGNQPYENLQFDSDPELLAQFARCARLYRDLAPLRRRLMREAAATGAPLARHLFFHYPRRPEARACKDAFLLGPNLLVAPVLKPGRAAREVFVPEEGFTNLRTGQAVQAGRVTLPAPLGEPLLLAREGSAVAAELRAAGYGPAGEKGR